MNILIADDEPLKRVSLQIDLTEAGYHVVEAADAAAALEMMQQRPVDVVVTDLRMPGMDGLAFLDEIKRRHPDTDVILMTAYATVETAVDAMKRGAYDYITKPFPAEILLGKLERLRAYRTAKHPAGEMSLGRLVGASAPMQQLYAAIRDAAAADGPVLIVGGPGVGKTLVAETLVQLGGRRAAPLVRVECESVGEPDALAERLRHAEGGTVLLESVNRLSPPAQARLSDFLATRQVRLGAESFPGDVRVVATAPAATTTGDGNGSANADLAARLAAQTLVVPSLCERRHDIPALVQELVRRHAALAGAAPGAEIPVSLHTMDALAAAEWAGNVRELEHVIQQALPRCGGVEIRPEHLAGLIDRPKLPAARYAGPEVGEGLSKTVADIERLLIESALRHSAGNQAQAAQLLRIPRTTLRDKMAKYGLVGEQFNATA